MRRRGLLWTDPVSVLQMREDTGPAMSPEQATTVCVPNCNSQRLSVGGVLIYYDTLRTAKYVSKYLSTGIPRRCRDEGALLVRYSLLAAMYYGIRTMYYGRQGPCQ